MNKKRKRIIILLSAFLIVVFLFFLYIIDHQKKEKLIADIKTTISMVQANKIPNIDFSTFTPNNWDRLFIFGPYTSYVEIDNALGRFWLYSRFTTIESNDRVNLLVFTKGNRVVEYIEFFRGNGDFSTAQNEIGYPRLEAKFIMDAQGRIYWLYKK